VTVEYKHLAGIPFTGIGKRDCYALVRDFMRDNFNVELTNFARPHDWSSDEIDLFENLHEVDGWVKHTDFRVKELRPGDVLAMSVGESNPNHLAVFVGDDTIVHHLYGKMSRYEPFAGFWRNHISYMLRHPAVPDLRPTYPDVDIMDLLRARNTTPTG
jgi:cell wall-associated NlpC family hydrolase